MIKVKDTPFQQPDASRITPVYVPRNGTRSYTLDVIFINGQGKYQNTPGYWDDIDKCWRYHNGEALNYEVVRTEPLKETERHRN